jgi:hypothetical protein
MSTLTVTGKIGPGLDITALPMQVKGFSINCDTELLSIIRTDDRIVDVDITLAATITVTVVGNNYTINIA